MTPPVFWDIKEIIWIARATPYLEEIPDHQCDCEHCTQWSDWYRKCSKCSHEEYYIDDFKEKGRFRICPACKEELISEDEYNSIIDNKRKAYTLPIKK